MTVTTSRFLSGATMAFHLEATSFGTTIINPYSESDAIGYQFESGSRATTITGGYSHDTINIVNNGGMFSFLGNYMNSAPFTYSTENAGVTQYPNLTPIMAFPPTSNVTATIGTFIGLELNNPTDGFTSGLTWVSSSASTTASYTYMLYGPMVSPDTCVGAPLLVSSSGTTANIILSGANAVKWPALTFMPQGSYCGMLEFASTTQNYQRQSNQTIANGVCETFAAGSYGVPSSTGMAFTSTGSSCPYITVQMSVASNTY